TAPRRAYAALRLDDGRLVASCTTRDFETVWAPTSVARGDAEASANDAVSVRTWEWKTKMPRAIPVIGSTTLIAGSDAVSGAQSNAFCASRTPRAPTASNTHTGQLPSKSKAPSAMPP